MSTYVCPVVPSFYCVLHLRLQMNSVVQRTQARKALRMRVSLWTGKGLHTMQGTHNVQWAPCGTGLHWLRRVPGASLCKFHTLRYAWQVGLGKLGHRYVKASRSFPMEDLSCKLRLLNSGLRTSIRSLCFFFRHPSFLQGGGGNYPLLFKSSIYCLFCGEMT